MNLSKALRLLASLSVLLGGMALATPPTPVHAQSSTATPVPPPALNAPTPTPKLSQVKSWGYQLQKADPAAIAASPYDLVVIDYSRDGGDARAFSPGEIARMQVKPDGSRRIVLSYLSIGEAEDYRYYWRKRWSWMSAGFWRWAFQLFGDRFVPGWLGPHNNHWRGNYGVRYWQDGWQDIILGSPDGYLQRIARAGFDGVYLDKIDEFADMARENVRARPDMIAFVVRLAKTARALKPGFLVVPQNGEELLRDAGYRAVIDGLGKEDLLFGDPKERVWNAPDQVARNVRDLALLVADGKPVLTVEYVAEPSLLAQARRENERYRFIPHFADRTLDSLRVDAPATLDIGPRGR